MPFNGSGGTSQPSGSIYPATANTLIESAKANTSIADIYTMLASCIVKDGQTTTTQRIPFAAGASMGSQTITAVGDGTAVTHAATVGQVRSGAPVLLGSVAGTNTITAALTPALTAYAAGNKFILTPANTNTGATTVNVDSVGAKNIFWNGAACVGGELRQNIPALIEYDGTQFHIVGNGFNAPFLDTHAVVEGSADSTKKARFEVDGLTTATTRVYTLQDSDDTLVGRATTDTLTNKTLVAPVLGTPASGSLENCTNTVVIGTPQATTSGTSFNFTGIAAGTRQIDIILDEISLSGTDNLLVQIGPSGGVETTSYLATGNQFNQANATSGTNATNGFVISVGSAAFVCSGVLRLTHIGSNRWIASGVGKHSTTVAWVVGGSKTLAGELTQFTLTRTGTDTFDAGQVNYLASR